jgi:hypothetical protein
MITDTTPEAQKRQHEIFARMSGEQRVRMAMELSDNVRDVAWQGFRRRHPMVSEEALRPMFLMELHGIELPRRSEGQTDE